MIQEGINSLTIMDLCSVKSTRKSLSWKGKGIVISI